MNSRVGWHLSAILSTARRVLRIEEPNAPFMVSFPRSGSHYLSLCLEKYTDGQSPISGYQNLAGKSLLVHRIHAGGFRTTHDMQLGEFHRTVVYLYRNPLDTLYSFLHYEGIPKTRENAVAQADLWSEHTLKWMFRENQSRRKIILCYERLMKDFPGEFGKLARFLGLPEDATKMTRAGTESSKGEIKKLVEAKDPKAIVDSREYHDGRGPFLERFREAIMSRVPAELRAVLDRDAAETGKGALAAG